MKVLLQMVVIGLVIQICGVVMAQEGRQLVREKVSANAEKRLALVIGNGRYTNVSPLDNPVNDASDMAAALQKLGFEVIKGTDTNLVQMRRLIREFGEKLEVNKGVGLFYYAGHGVEVRGKNFLVPIDADIAREVETEDYAIDVNSILRQMDAAANGFNVVILDACRNNPFSRGWNRSGDTGGLANVLAPTGTYIAFAAAPGSTASDGKGTRNGIFTGALIKHLARPKLKLEEVFKATREEVMTLTARKQVPWDSSSIQGDFYFNSNGTAVGNIDRPATSIPVIEIASASGTDDPLAELEAWNKVKTSTVALEYYGFLRQYPNGSFAKQAREKMNEIGDPEWDRVKASNDPTVYRSYIAKNPNSPFIEEARQEYKRLAIEAVEWETIERSTNSADFEGFLERHPETKNTVARKRLEELVWTRIKDDSKLHAFIDYLAKYPASSFADDAQSRISDISLAKLLTVDKYTDMGGDLVEIRFIKNGISVIVDKDAKDKRSFTASCRELIETVIEPWEDRRLIYVKIKLNSGVKVYQTGDRIWKKDEQEKRQQYLNAYQDWARSMANHCKLARA